MTLSLAKFRSEHSCKFINIADVEWEYISCGNGIEVLLLLTGGLRVAESAFDLIQMFEDTCRVIVPTYPPLRTMDEVADGVAAILDMEQVSEAFVLGQSYGGAVAQVFLQRYCSRVKKLVLSGTTPLVVVKWKQVLLHILSIIAVLFPEKMVMRIFKRMVSPLLTVQESKRAFWKTYLDELFEHHLTKADLLSHFKTLLDAQTKYAYARGERSSWNGKVLIIWGENDPVSTERSQRGMLDIYPKAQIHIIAGGGHTPAMSKPGDYAKTVKGFLTEDG